MPVSASGLLGVAIVGSGGMAAARAEDLAACGGARLVVIAGRNQRTAAALARRFGVEHSRDALAAVRRGDVDAVMVTTHPDTHAAFGAAALAAGKHLFSESPLALTPLDAAQLLDLARAHGLVVRVGHTSPLRPAPRLIRAQVNALGGALHDTLVIQFPNDRRAGRGAGFVPSVSGHPVTYAVVLGLQVIHGRGPIVRIDAAAAVDGADGRHAEVEAPAAGAGLRPFERCAAVVTLQFQDGGLATIVYRRGFDGPSSAGRVVVCRRGEVRYQEGADHVRVVGPDGARALPVPAADPWAEELDEFLAAVGHGRPMSISAADAARVVALVDAARRAAERGPAAGPL